MAEQRFEIALEDGDLALADYRREGDRVIFPHTVVPAAHGGQGLGSALVRASLDWARAEKLQVVPSCSFFRSYMERHPETQDLLGR
jgi:predicted GNAT family acetyltransferase